MKKFINSIINFIINCFYNRIIHLPDTRRSKTIVKKALQRKSSTVFVLTNVYTGKVFVNFALVTVRKQSAVLDLPSAYPARLTKVKAVFEKVNTTTKVTFVAGRLTALSNAIDDFEAKQLLVTNRVPGNVQLRNSAYTTVKDMLLDEFKGIIQTKVDASLPENAEEIITSCGYRLKVVTIREKQKFEATNLETGKTKITAPGGPKRSAHNWQRSVNQTVWTSLNTSIEADTIDIHNITPGTRVYYRHQLIISRTEDGKGGAQAWSDPISIIVI